VECGMIYILLNAFEAATKENDNFFKNVKKVGVFFVIAVIVLVALITSTVILCYLKFFKIAVILFLIYIIAALVLSIIGDNINRKNWKDKIKQYNDKLDKLEEILFSSDFGINSEEKIIKVIEKCNAEVAKMEDSIDKQKEKSNKFVGIYILPVLAFVAGKINVGVNMYELISYGIVAIVLICIFAYSVREISDFISKFTYRSTIKLQYLSERLQDLLDRGLKVDSNVD